MQPHLALQRPQRSRYPGTMVLADPIGCWDTWGKAFRENVHHQLWVFKWMYPTIMLIFLLVKSTFLPVNSDCLHHLKPQVLVQSITQEQVDEHMTGSISKKAFLATAQRLGLSDGAGLAFSFAQQMEGAACYRGWGPWRITSFSSLLGNYLLVTYFNSHWFF